MNVSLKIAVIDFLTRCTAFLISNQTNGVVKSDVSESDRHCGRWEKLIKNTKQFGIWC